MFIVTGGCGFIGSNIAKNLKDRGHRVTVVDRITNEKIQSMRSLGVDEYFDYKVFFDDVYGHLRDHVDGIFHEGAISDTTYSDHRVMMANNYENTKQLVDICFREDIPLVYASSAAVYGMGQTHYHFREVDECELPLNVYGFSKLMVDRYVREKVKGAHMKAPLVGLRYFNVYGPGEEHKGKMASLAYQMFKNDKPTTGPCLFGEYGGYADGEHRRDFVFISDVVDVNMHFMFGGAKTGVFNVGTGESRTFNDVCRLVTGKKPFYLLFPKELEGKYQCFTEADLRHLRTSGGFHAEFHPLEEGLEKSMKEWWK